MVSKKKGAPVSAGPSAKALREADLVMGTNNSSIVSKRSVEMFYYPTPHFFRYFVKKPQRRSPLINRGYWLRMYAMMESVRRFMQEPSDKPKFVLNLGCGFDPLPFMLLSADGPLCRDSNTTFVDIDYEKLMLNKKTAIHRTPEIIEVLQNVEFLPDENDAVQVRSDRYLAIGCDLKNLKKLDDTLRTRVLPSSDCSILCLAEVSLTYMDVKSANAVVNWASKLSDDAQFCILEQFFPDGPQHPFASTMMKHFNKLGAPLFSIHEYPALHQQEQRFKDAGWAQAQARSLWDLWSDDDFLSPSTRISLDAVEPFDEWEEFALFASHYFLLHAHASTCKPASNGDSSQANNGDSQTNVSDQFKLIPHCPPKGGQRRYGALIPDGKNSVGHYGGLGRQTRLATTDLYTNSEEITTPLNSFPPRDISARMCHTVTNFQNGDCLLVGGRTAPGTVFDDCWFRKDNTWASVESLPIPRFRHSATRITFGTDSEGVLVYGGKTKTGQSLDTWLLRQNTGSGWQTIEMNDPKPIARFGACLTSISDTFGVMFGGIGADGTIMEDFWTWELHQKSDGSFLLNLTDRTKDLQAASSLFKYLNRFAATIDKTSWGLVIVGGIMPNQIVPYDKEILLLDSAKLLECLNGTKPWDTTRLLSTVGLGAEFDGPRPLLTGHVSYAVDPDQMLILGGGAVCFSFGTFWTEGTWLLKRSGSSVENAWEMIFENVQPAKSTESISKPSVTRIHEVAKEITPIPRVRVESSAQFQQVLANGKPVVIEGSDLGPCTERWTKEYLTSTVGSDRKVVVHEAGPENMNFQSKNFSYTTKPFGAFLDEVHAGGRQYLRSISAEQPTKQAADLASDFPSLKDDFQLPEQLSFAAENAHSSPLRISGSVGMWLHYDVMANVLCQIRGERRLVLYPPTDVQHLHVPPGASSSIIDIFQNTGDGSSIISIPHTLPQETTLKPGDILFLPPLWLHTASACPTGQVSVAVNVFFRSLDKGYAAGRDVYGNRDLQAYEKCRNDVQKIARSFQGLPRDMARFYLLRLAQELKGKAEE